MKARDIFGIIVRSLGVVLLLFSLWYLCFGVAEVFGVPEDRAGEAKAYFTAGVPGLLVAVAFLRFARAIVGFCYPGNKDDSDA